MRTSRWHASSSAPSHPCPLPSGLCFGAARGGRDGTLEALEASGGTGKPLPLEETLNYTRSLLQAAVEVEHGTVPLYLTALWSIVNGSDAAASVIHSVVVEEMLHMTIAANTLNAIGGAPKGRALRARPLGYLLFAFFVPFLVAESLLVLLIFHQAKGILAKCVFASLQKRSYY